MAVAIRKSTVFQDILNGKIPLSQSIIVQFLQCPQQFVHYMNRWSQPGRELNTFFGTCCHELLETFYRAGVVPTDEMLAKHLSKFIKEGKASGELSWLQPSEQAYQEAIILATMGEYFQYYADELGNEYVEIENKFVVPFNGFPFKLTGKRDITERLPSGKLVLRDHKTAGEISEDEKMMHLPINFQMLFYVLTYYLEHKVWVDYYEHNVIRRTKTKPKFGERLKTFAERLRSEIHAKPAYFFMRYRCKVDAEAMTKFADELVHILAKIEELCKAQGSCDRNLAFCVGTYKCPYLHACASGSMEQYYRRKKISPEL